MPGLKSNGWLRLFFFQGTHIAHHYLAVHLVYITEICRALRKAVSQVTALQLYLILLH